MLFFLRGRCAGPIPEELGALSKLQHLNLERNQLSGKESAKYVHFFRLLKNRAWTRMQLAGQDLRRSTI